MDIKIWNKELLNDFAKTIGSSLEKLGKEYDLMISDFELQITQLRTFTKYEPPVVKPTADCSPSSTHSAASPKKREGKKKGKIHTSFRVANIRRKLSSRTVSPCPPGMVARGSEVDSSEILSRINSDLSIENDVYEKRSDL